MEKREMKLVVKGQKELYDLTFTHADDGLTIQSPDNAEKYCHLSPDSVKTLGDWINKSKDIDKDLNSEDIPYEDMPYVDKRKILRQLSAKDEIRNYLSIMTNEIYKNLVNTRFGVDKILYDAIKTLLIDGYVAFEIMYDDKGVYKVEPLDPSTLIVDYDPDGVLRWFQYPHNAEMRRTFTDDQIAYIIYSDEFDINVSYVDELKESYDMVKHLESIILKNVIKGERGELAYKMFKKANTKLKFVSKIPKSILEKESHICNDLRYNAFIYRISKLFRRELFDKIKETKQQ